MKFLLHDTAYFSSSKSKEEIKSLILNNSSVHKFNIKNFFIPSYQGDKLLCTFKDYSFRLTLLKYYSREYEIIITGNISETKDGTRIKIKARAGVQYILFLILFGIPLSIGLIHSIYSGHYLKSILCTGIFSAMYLGNYLLFKYESVRFIQVVTRVLNDQKPFLSNVLDNKPDYIKP